jgi:hypothetical protein
MRDISDDEQRSDGPNPRCPKGCGGAVATRPTGLSPRAAGVYDISKAMLRRIVPLLLAATFAASAQKYDGPRPPKPDLPYIKHASSLVATEPSDAKEEKVKQDTTYSVQGTASSARTPLASPIFIFLSDKITPEKFGLYKFTVNKGRREITFGPKKQAQPIHLEVKRLDKGLYMLEAVESLEPGEYSLSPEGSNQVFCFQVF